MAEELSRELWDQDSYVHESRCLGCEKQILLWYNGGELDHQTCCGYEYALESPESFYVVSKLEPPDVPKEA